ncbi:MAG: DUF4439 domain-containing protein [Actinomycetes bacterium]|jgi:hypothetical protein
MSGALEQVIQGEEAAVYAYGRAAPYLSGAENDRVRGGLVAHQQRVTALRAELNVQSQPQAPLGFEVPQVIDGGTARSLLGEVEARLSAQYADLAAASTGDQRRDAVLIARECAVRSITWGAAPQPFPGR